MANEVKWIKLDVDIFDNVKIKKIRRLPEGNNVLLIWVMLLTMAGKCNAGGMIHITDTVLYTVEDLADELDFSVDTVKLALSSLEKLGMIILDNERGIGIKNWDEYQNVDGMERIREQNRIRKQNQREREKHLLEEKEMSRDSHATVTQSSYSISSSKSNSLSFSKEIKEIIDYINLVCSKHYTYKNSSYNKKIRARLKDGYTVEDFKTVIDKKFTTWHGTEFEMYLTPDTLFRPGKFETYLNETVVVEKTKGEKQLDATMSALNEFLTKG